jgi:hypothetical protein
LVFLLRQPLAPLAPSNLGVRRQMRKLTLTLVSIVIAFLLIIISSDLIFGYIRRKEIQIVDSDKYQLVDLSRFSNAIAIGYIGEDENFYYFQLVDRQTILNARNTDANLQFDQKNSDTNASVKEYKMDLHRLKVIKKGWSKNPDVKMNDQVLVNGSVITRIESPK